MGKMIYLDQILSFNWFTTSDLFNYLEYHSMKGNFTKEEHNENILYIGKDFSILNCSKTKNIFVDKSLEYNDSICN